MPAKEDDVQMKEACLAQILNHFQVILESLLFIIMKQTRAETQTKQR